MKKGKKNYLFFLVLSFIMLSNYFSMNIVYADGSVGTKGVIQLYSDTSSSTETSATNVSDHSTKKQKFPSTGEIVGKGILLIGIFICIFVLLIFFFRKKNEEKNKDEN